jgi:hypothetical protein
MNLVPDLLGALVFPFQVRRGGGGFIGDMIRWFIMVAIYDLAIGSIASIFGVSRMVAVLIFLAVLLGISVVGYLIRQRTVPGVDDRFR